MGGLIMHRASLIVFAITVAALASSAIDVPTARSQGTPADNFLVVPGQGIGPIRLGMTLDEATQVFGRYNDKYTIGNYGSVQAVNYWWKRAPGSFGVQTRKDNAKIVMIMAQADERYGLEGGQVHIGVPEAAVSVAMGTPKQVFRYQNDHTLAYGNVGFKIWDQNNSPTNSRWTGKVYLIEVGTNIGVAFSGQQRSAYSATMLTSDDSLPLFRPKPSAVIAPRPKTRLSMPHRPLLAQTPSM